MNSLSKQKYSLYIAIGILWLFHVSGIIGISLGYQEWFASRTFLNLNIIFLVLLIFYPVNSIKKGVFLLLFGGLGYFAEYLGVNFGLFFGDYSYGNNFGPKIQGVPILIGLNWAILTFVCGSIANKISKNLIIKSLIGTSMMLFLDVFMEKVAPLFDFWEFSGGDAPIDNYIAWGVISLIFHLIFHSAKIKGHFQISIHIYIVQLLFFIYFYVYY